MNESSKTIIVPRTFNTGVLFKSFFKVEPEDSTLLFSLIMANAFKVIATREERTTPNLINVLADEYTESIGEHLTSMPINYHVEEVDPRKSDIWVKISDKVDAVPNLKIVKRFAFIDDLLSDDVDVMKTLTQDNGCYILEREDVHEVYVGQSVLLARRLGEHKYRAKNRIHHSVELNKIYNGIGKLSVTVFVVNDESQLETLEKKLIHYCNRFTGVLNTLLLKEIEGYEVIVRSRNGLLEHSDETKKRMSEVRKGRKLTEEHKLKSSIGHSKPVSIEGKWYLSATSAAKDLNMIQTTVMRRLSNDKFPDWFYIGGKGDPEADQENLVMKRKSNASGGRTISIKGKFYNSAREAEKDLNVSAKTVHRRCGYSPIDYPQWKDWFFVDTDE